MRGRTKQHLTGKKKKLTFCHLVLTGSGVQCVQILVVPSVGCDLVASLEGIRDHIGIFSDLSVVTAIDKEGDLGFTGDLVQFLQQLASELVRTIIKGDGNGAWCFAGVDLGIPCSTLLQLLSNGTVAEGAVGREGGAAVGVEHGGSVDEDGRE